VRVYNPTFEQHGWKSPHTAVEIVSDDMPFLVDSVSMVLSRRELGIHVFVHPVVGDESYMHIEVDRQANGLEALAEAIRNVLAQVRAAVEDWQPMRERMRALIDEPAPPGIDVTEARALLAWLADDHFTFLGYREYELTADALRAVEGSGLGLLRGGGGTSSGFAKLPLGVRALAREPDPLVLAKANTRSPIHRPAYLDYVGVKKFDDQRNVIGERRFLGLYTTAAYREVPARIPVLREKAASVRERAGFPPGSHDDKAVVEIVDTFPRDELFQIDVDDLYRIVTGILELGERQRVRLFMRTDRYERFVACLVFLPRDRFNTANRTKIAEILRAGVGAETVDWELRLTEWVLVRLHFTLRLPPGARPSYDADELEAKIREAVRSWDDDLDEALVDELGEETGTALYRRYRDAFPAAYRDDLLARSAVADVQRIEGLSEEALDLSLYRPLEAPPEALRCKLYRRGERISLSVVLPMFESLGLTVTDERPYRVTPKDGPPAWIYDFGLQAKGPVDADAIRDRFHDGFARVWAGEVELDGFNALIIAAGLDWREVTMLRAVARYLRQAGIPFSDRCSPTRAWRRRSWSCSRRASIRPGRGERRNRWRRRSRPPSTRSTRSTRTASCARFSASSKRCCGRTTGCLARSRI
jgi:glutamate dehydrogenase